MAPVCWSTSVALWPSPLGHFSTPSSVTFHPFIVLIYFSGYLNSTSVMLCTMHAIILISFWKKAKFLYSPFPESQLLLSYLVMMQFVRSAWTSAYLFVSFVQLSQIMIPSPPHHLYNPSLMNSPMSCADRCQGKILSRGKVLIVSMKGKDNITKMLFDLYDMRMVFFDFTGSVRL